MSKRPNDEDLGADRFEKATPVNWQCTTCGRWMTGSHEIEIWTEDGSDWVNYSCVWCRQRWQEWIATGAGDNDKGGDNNKGGDNDKGGDGGNGQGNSKGNGQEGDDNSDSMDVG